MILRKKKIIINCFIFEKIYSKENDIWRIWNIIHYSFDWNFRMCGLVYKIFSYYLLFENKKKCIVYFLKSTTNEISIYVHRFHKCQRQFSKNILCDRKMIPFYVKAILQNTWFLFDCKTNMTRVNIHMPVRQKHISWAMISTENILFISHKFYKQTKFRYKTVIYNSVFLLINLWICIKSIFK